MDHPGVSLIPTGPRSPVKLSQVFSEALRHDREVTEGDEEDHKEGEIETSSLEFRAVVGGGWDGGRGVRFGGRGGRMGVDTGSWREKGTQEVSDTNHGHVHRPKPKNWVALLNPRKGILRASIQAPQDADIPSSSMGLCPSSPAHKAEERDEALDHPDVNKHDTSRNEEDENEPSAEIQTMVNMQLSNPRQRPLSPLSGNHFIALVEDLDQPEINEQSTILNVEEENEAMVGIHAMFSEQSPGQRPPSTNS
ncbi:hypothetical protein U1Q18_022596 [Sarracenia purpurea var. burkii]